jgi:hypothetical protein
MLFVRGQEDLVELAILRASVVAPNAMTMSP